MNSNTSNRDEIDIAGFLKSIKLSLLSVFKKWYVLLIAGLIGMGIGCLTSWIYGVSYLATSSYTVQNQQSSSVLNSALSLASTFGLSSKSGTSAYDNNFFAALMKSKRIVKGVLMQHDRVNGKDDLLANHFYQISKFKNKWNNDALLKDFKFKHNQLNKLSILEDSVLSIYFDLITDKFLTVAYDPNVPFNALKFVSGSRDFSIVFSKHLIKEISDYYTNTILLYNETNLVIAQKRVDSLATAMNEMDNKVARLKDNSTNTIRQQGTIALNDAIRNQGLLNMQYAAAVNNFELTKTSLLSAAPILQIIDEPEYSIEVKSISMKLAAVVGALLCIFLSAFIIAAATFFRQ